MRALLFKGQVFGLLLIVLFMAGCRTITVTATDDICKKSVEVHLVGVNRFEKSRWESVSMTDYWKPGSDLRQSSKGYRQTVQFPIRAETLLKGETPCLRSIAAKDKHPIWDIWKARSAEYLFVLADLPRGAKKFEDLKGNADARRLCLPLSSGCWSKGKIDISVEAANIVSLTIPKLKPECRCD
ncbi:MAG: hypothetical protein ACYTFK_07035 [Planctomycetota bacterium]|jgi:hypothetical protein